MMRLVKKKLLTGARGDRSKQSLCLVINLGDGMRVQYPVSSEKEAIALYDYYSKLHPYLQPATPQG